MYATRADAGNRRGQAAREKELLDAVRDLLKKRNSHLELKVFEVDRGHPEKTLDVYKHAAVVFGPHGAQLWNFALAPPGGLAVEFNTYDDMFVKKDCRLHGFSLANAAGMDYGLVETANFDYFTGDEMLPDTTALVEIIRHFLDKKGW